MLAIPGFSIGLLLVISFPVEDLVKDFQKATATNESKLVEWLSKHRVEIEEETKVEGAGQDINFTFAKTLYCYKEGHACKFHYKTQPFTETFVSNRTFDFRVRELNGKFTLVWAKRRTESDIPNETGPINGLGPILYPTNLTIGFPISQAFDPKMASQEKLELKGSDLVGSWKILASFGMTTTKDFLVYAEFDTTKSYRLRHSEASHAIKGINYKSSIDIAYLDEPQLVPEKIEISHRSDGGLADVTIVHYNYILDEATDLSRLTPEYYGVTQEMLDAMDPLPLPTGRGFNFVWISVCIGISVLFFAAAFLLNRRSRNA